MQRSPEGEITTYEELSIVTGCCEVCHAFYPHYDMYIVQLLSGRGTGSAAKFKRRFFPLAVPTQQKITRIVNERFLKLLLRECG